MESDGFFVGMREMPDRQLARIRSLQQPDSLKEIEQVTLTEKKIRQIGNCSPARGGHVFRTLLPPSTVAVSCVKEFSGLYRPTNCSSTQANRKAPVAWN